MYAKKEAYLCKPLFQLLSCAWEKVTITFLQRIRCNVSIDLRGAQTTVTEQLLHGTQVSPVIQ